VGLEPWALWSPVYASCESLQVILKLILRSAQ
jgi:hypothetical protein